MFTCRHWLSWFQIEVLNKHLLLTSKPVIYLVNLSEKDYIRKKNKWSVFVYLSCFQYVEEQLLLGVQSSLTQCWNLVLTRSPVRVWKVSGKYKSLALTLSMSMIFIFEKLVQLKYWYTSFYGHFGINNSKQKITNAFFFQPFYILRIPPVSVWSDTAGLKSTKQ